MQSIAMKGSALTVEDRRLLRCILLDLIVMVVLTIPTIICEFVIQPTRRGFFCSDETIRYPFQSNTITAVILAVFIIVLPAFVVIVVEFTRFYRRGRVTETRLLFGWKVPIWIVECLKYTVHFAFGATLTLAATELGKYTIGRLRPHFIAVCQPQLADGSSCDAPQNIHRYIENYICVGSGYAASEVREARLSFPSGHSSLCFFAMTYLCIYLQHKLTWNASKFARNSLQFSLLMLASFTALTRIMDNWHHWSDVLVGCLLGLAIAVITAIYLTKDFSTPLERLHVNLPRQDTSTTLDEIAVTPPPYTMRNGVGNVAPSLDRNSAGGFGSEQFNSKV
ncbi:putative phosphatidate phosphatase [Rhagoletis pomonella]|uniref:putative phosphatidate phosphatase n=1 Tax=Rhagoletis pomonella TaxID=28610 RepID=UPI00177CCCF7|nr:putative phosphatidate phosphatase [Rhagoletis pomonella]